MFDVSIRMSDGGVPEAWSVGEGEEAVGYFGTIKEAGEVSLLLRHREAERYKDVRVKPDGAKVKAENGCIETIFTVSRGGKTVVNAGILYRIVENSVFVEWGGVTETEGWQLLEITLPSLISGRDKENPRFFHCENRGGYLADLRHMDKNALIRGEARFHGYPNASVLPVVGILKENSLCVMEVQGYVCRTLLDAVAKDRVSIGVSAPWRIPGKEHTPDIPVNQKNIARVEFMLYPRGRKAEWIDAAKLVKAHFSPLKDNFFDDKFVFIVQNQLGRKPVELDYAQTEALLKRISNITAGNPMVAFLTGWSQGGHDTSYPNAYIMNQNLGSDEEFLEVKKRVKEKYGCTLSLNDNFDDMYFNEYTWDGWIKEKYIARTADNEPETFETWNGVDKSYITGMHNYMKPGEDGEKRIWCHGEQHQLEDAILIDAMSWWSIRNDWNPEAPASAVDNLRAKFGIIDTFYEKYGIRVLSELVRYPFIGKLQVAFDNGAAYDRPSCHDIPFLRTVLCGVMYYGGRGGDSLDVPDMLYHNAAKHPWFRRGESAERIADIFYLNYVPWFLLKKLELRDYRGTENTCELILERDSCIRIDYSLNTWSVDYEGVRIMEGMHLICPFGENSIAFYAKEDCVLCYAGLEGRKILDAKLCREEGCVRGDAWTEDGKLYGRVTRGNALIVQLDEKPNR